MKLFAKDELKYLWAFYIERFISHVLFFAPAFWIVLFNQTLSLGQIGILFSIFAVSTFIFEIPTGAFADIFGRKASTLFSYLSLGILLPMFTFVTEFYTLIVLFTLWGLFGTFYSGAREAWTIDNLKYYKKEELIKSYYLKNHSLMRIGLFLSGFLGAFVVATLGITSIWIFAGLSWIVSFLLLLPVKEHKLTKESKVSFKKLYKQSKEAISYTLKHQVLLFVLLSGFFIMFRDSFGGTLIWLPFLKDLGLQYHSFGFLFSASMLLGSIAPMFANPLLKICKNEKNYLILLLVLGMLVNFSVFFVKSYILGIVFMLLIFFLLDLFSPIVGSFQQKFIPSKNRATIVSFRSMMTALAYAVSYPFAGLVADLFGSQRTIILAGLFLVPAIYLFSKIKVKGKKVK